MPTINEKYTSRSVQSIRVNDRLIESCKKTGIPISNIVENSLVYFSGLPDEQKIQFLVNNDPDKVDSSKIIDPGYNFAEVAVKEAKRNLGKQSSGIATKVLIAIGLAILVAIFVKQKD